MQQDRDQGPRTEASPLALVSDTTASAFEEAQASFERFCLAAGIEAMEALLEEPGWGWGPIRPTSICGHRHGRDAERAVYRWGTTISPVGFHGGKRGGEVPLDGFAELQSGDLLQAWAYELMLLGVATRGCGDPPLWPGGSPGGGRLAAPGWRWDVEVGGVSALCRDEPSQARRLAGP